MKKIKVAVIPSEGLGDGLIQLVIANNLQILGYEVTFYNNHVKALENYIEHVNLKGNLTQNGKVAELEQYHIIMYDLRSNFAKNAGLEIKTWLKFNAIPFKISSSRIKEFSPNLDNLKQRLGKDLEHLAEFFIQFYGQPKSKKWFVTRPPMVEQIKSFFQHKLKSPYATSAAGINLQAFKKVAKHKRRIVIHPTSSNENKNWRIEQYIELANMLKKAGWQPVFTVAPYEKAEWLKLVNGKFAVPEFPSIEDLAKYYAASFAFIGNDSGNAHLASLLGLPNLVIFSRWRKNPGFRPGWAKTKTVLANFPFNFKKVNWQQGIQPKKVFSNFNKMIAGLKNDQVV